MIPVYNEEKNVGVLHRELLAVLKRLKKSYEIIFVDDGSVDGTLAVLKNLENIKIIHFQRNFGQTAALLTGFNQARGKVVVTLDGDLQNDPRDIFKLLEKLDEGYDLISGWRFKRVDPLSKRFPSLIANWLVARITGIKIHDFGCTLKAYRQEMIKGLPLYGEMHRFLPVLIFDRGGKIAEVKVKHRRRRFGASKYGFSRTMKVILDLITVKFFLSYSSRPMQVFGAIGLILDTAGFLIAAYLSLMRIFYKMSLADKPLLFLGVLLIIVGIQFMGIGLLAEIMMRIYFRVYHPPYVIKKTIRRSKH